LRHAVLEIFEQFPNDDVLKPYVVDLYNVLKKVLDEDNEENALLAVR